MKTTYVGYDPINELQTKIMCFVDEWVREEKTPVPHKEILNGMEKAGVKTFTTVNALQVLLKKGYLRRAEIISNKSFYVMLRKV